jgi:SAM-dependent methyltransferase
VHDLRGRTATLFDSKVSAFAQSEHEHQGSVYPPDVLQLISRIEIQSVLERLDLNAQMRVLDVGAGGGRWTLALAERVGAVTAVEPSALFALLSERTASFPNVTCIKQPFEDLRVDEPYDLVIIYGTLMYVTTDEAAREFLTKAANAVRTGGHLVLSEAVARRYKCLADWEETTPEVFAGSALARCAYWEVLRPLPFYRRVCRAAGLSLVADFESHAPVFGRSKVWPWVKALRWPLLQAYNRTWRNPYGRLKWLLDMRRMRMMLWTRKA